VAAAIAVLVPASAARADPVASDVVPTSAVARIGDGLISHQTFRHWLGIAAASNPSTGRVGQSYHPPGFVSCVRLKRQTRRGRARTRAALKRECKQEYEGLRDQVLQFLILERWVAGEAAERGLVFTEEELDAAFEQAKDDTFPKESDFRRFLRQSGMTVADARFQVAFNTRYTRLRELAIASAPAVTEADIVAYYKRHRDEFAEPERRDLRVVLTRTRALAVAAMRAIERGRSWARVAREYSIDRVSRARGGWERGVVEGSRERALDDALFRAPVGKLRGPVKTDFGYYVFKVVKVRPAGEPTLKRARPVIRELLTMQRELEADDAFNEGFRAKWRARTTCRSGYIMDQCRNAPSR